MRNDFFSMKPTIGTRMTCSFNIARQIKLPGRVISQRSNMDWPPSPYDLTPIDFFCRGAIC